MNLDDERDRLDWRENLSRASAYDPLEICVWLAATLAVVAVYNLLRG